MRQSILMVTVLVLISVVCAWGAVDLSPNHLRSTAEWDSHWREGGYDAVTSLYVLFRLQNRPIRYEELASEERLVGNCSFATLLAVAKERDAGVVLRKCSATELNRIALPAIIHVDSKRDSSAGEFVTLINRTRDSWTTVNGANGTLSELDSNVLLRQWSGYVMTTHQHRAQWHVIMIVIIAGGLLGRLVGRQASYSRAKATESKELTCV